MAQSRRIFHFHRSRIQIASVKNLMGWITNHFPRNVIGFVLLGSQRFQHRMIHQAEQRLLIREFDFPLLWMYVHIDALRWHLERQHQEGISVFRKQRMVRIVYRFRHHCTFYHAAVDNHRLVLATGFQKRGLRNHTGQQGFLPFAGHFQHFTGRLGSIQRRNHIHQTTIAWGFNDGASIIDEPKGDIRIGQCQFSHHPIDAAGFSPFRFQKFLSSRHVIK